MQTPLIVGNVPPAGWLIIAIVILVLFGRDKISSLMGEVGKGITSFRKGIKQGDKEIEDAAAEDVIAERDVTPEKARDVTPKTAPDATSETKKDQT